MAEHLSTTAADTRRLRRSFMLAVAFAVVLWLVKLAEFAFDLYLIPYGIYPRRASGIPGILWTPLIHGSFTHLLANTPAVIILGTVLLYGYPRSAKVVFPVVYLGSGLGIWLFARSSYHIGASGLSFGVLFFIFTIGALRWDKPAIALALIVFLLYGGMIWGIFPSKPDISFEAHFFGALLGVALAFLLRTHDPAPPRKRYSWEDEQENHSPEDETSRIEPE